MSVAYSDVGEDYGVFDSNLIKVFLDPSIIDGTPHVDLLIFINTELGWESFWLPYFEWDEREQRKLDLRYRPGGEEDGRLMVRVSEVIAPGAQRSGADWEGEDIDWDNPGPGESKLWRYYGTYKANVTPRTPVGDIVLGRSTFPGSEDIFYFDGWIDDVALLARH